MARSPSLKKIPRGGEPEGEEASQPCAPPPILDDRDFLNALDLGDSDAAMYLGKSRQTLNTMLGSQRNPSGQRAKRYLKCADMHQLISAAILRGTEFDSERLAVYIERERKDDPGRDIVLADLRAPKLKIDWEKAYAMILMLPHFWEIDGNRAPALQALRVHVKEMQDRQRGSKVVIISDSRMGAVRIAENLDLLPEQCQRNEVAENYFPSVLVYVEGEELPHLLLLTEDNKFVYAPQFSVDVISACVERFLPRDNLVRKEIGSRQTDARAKMTV